VAGVLAAVAVATLPSMLGHAAMATTDVAFVAMFLLATWTFVRWLERPSWLRAAALGGAVALAVLTKFTTLLFFPITAAALALGHLRAGGHRRTGPGLPVPAHRDWLRGAALAAGLALLTLWAGYRFSFGPVADPRFIRRTSFYEILKPEGQRTGLQALLGGRTLPAPEFFYGLLHLSGHNAVGHPAYLRGQLGQTGFAAFYPVALFYKAPLTFLLLVAVGLAALLAKVRDPRTARDLALPAATLGILIALMASRMNLGVRHALVVYPLWAIGAAVGLVRLSERLEPRRR
jgi:4-amino-4-deoxy-L-arabinose transferase-like glycosyltransferase